MKLLKCSGCGKMVTVLTDSACPTKCCGEPMEEMIAGTSDGAAEKHVPQVSVNGNVVTVDVGEVAHPMLDAHFIEWAVIETKEGAQYKALQPGDAPKLTFKLTDGDALTDVYAYCNLHGLWKAQL